MVISHRFNTATYYRKFSIFNTIFFSNALSCLNFAKVTKTFPLHPVWAVLLYQFFYLAHGLQLLNDFINLFSEFILMSHNLSQPGIQFNNIHLLAGVFLFNIGRYRKVITAFC